MKQYTDLERDILVEIGNIGTGNAVTSLSRMLGKKIEMSPPVLNILDINEVEEYMGGPEVEVTSVVLTLSRDMRGVVVFVLEQKFADVALDLLLGTNNHYRSEEGSIYMSEIEISAVQELGNIMASSYINAIAQMTGMAVELSTPVMSNDMVGSVLSVPYAISEEIGAKSLFIEGNFYNAEQDIKSYIILMPATESLEKMLEILGFSIT